ncbi:hypothetical protein MMC22_008986 [Lobaria immixta]|nr:hypothetical protein [Lobaria immixta]
MTGLQEEFGLSIGLMIQHVILATSVPISAHPLHQANTDRTIQAAHGQNGMEELSRKPSGLVVRSNVPSSRFQHTRCIRPTLTVQFKLPMARTVKRPKRPKRESGDIDQNDSLTRGEKGPQAPQTASPPPSNDNYIIPNLGLTWNSIPLDRINTEKWTSDVNGDISGRAARTITARSQSYNNWTVTEVNNELTKRGYSQTSCFMNAIKGDERRRILQCLDIGILPVFTLSATAVFRRAQTPWQLASSAIFIYRDSGWEVPTEERIQGITYKLMNMTAGFKSTYFPDAHTGPISQLVYLNATSSQKRISAMTGIMANIIKVPFGHSVFLGLTGPEGATTVMTSWAELAAIAPHISIYLAMGIRSKRIENRPSSASASTDPLERAFTAPSAANDDRCWGMCSLDRLLEVWHTKAPHEWLQYWIRRIEETHAARVATSSTYHINGIYLGRNV